mmetsp:Transcript_118116/g.294518  ORF Transcript_118116/g.294518 Transcript_118116/m.294518 type:complete len:217 (+) Transcript_118116:1731-2381(+)
MIPHNDSMPCARSVDLAQLHVNPLPCPQILRHVRQCLVVGISYGTTAARHTAAAVIERWSVDNLPVQAVGGACELRLCPQQHPVDVIQSTSVKPSQYVHVPLVHHCLVESACRGLHRGCIHFRPQPMSEVVLVEVWEAILRLVHAAESEHCITADDSGVAVACTWCCPMGWQHDPHVGGDVVLDELLQSVMAIPTAEDIHGVAVNHRCVSKAASRW